MNWIWEITWGKIDPWSNSFYYILTCQDTLGLGGFSQKQGYIQDHMPLDLMEVGEYFHVINA